MERKRKGRRTGKDPRSNYKQSKSRNDRDYKEPEGDQTPNGRLKSVPTENDISWWTKYPETAALAANLPFGSVTGFDVWNSIPITLPGIMALNTYITPGVNLDGASGANKAGKEVVKKVVQALGGSGEGDSADYNQLLLAVDSMYAFIAYCERIYGSIGLFSPVNRYTPEGLFDVQSLSLTDVVNNAPRLRVEINKWIDSLNQLPIPGGYSIIDRHVQIFGNYYTDVPSERGQIYLYNPKGFYVYNEAEGKLNFMAVPKAGLYTTVDELVTFGDYMMSKLRNSQSLVNMTARIKRAFGTKLYEFEHMPADYKVELTYSPEMLLEIHNTVMVGEPNLTASGYDSKPEYADLAITQSTANGDSFIINQPKIPMSNANIRGAYQDNKNFIDIPVSDVAQVPASAVLIATRGLVTVASGAGDMKLTSCGTEIVSSYTVLYREKNGSVAKLTPTFGRWTRYVSTATLDSIVFENFNIWSKFDWAPYIGQILDTTQIGLFGDINMYSPVDEATVRLLNEICVMSSMDCVDADIRKF